MNLGLEALFYDSWSTCYKEPFGAVEAGREVKFRMKSQRDYQKNIKGIELILRGEFSGRELRKHLELNEEDESYFVKIKLENIEELYFYYFEIKEEVNGHEIIRVYGVDKNLGLHGGAGKLAFSKSEISEYQLTVYKKGMKSPAWFKNGVLYHIFVDRFKNGNAQGKINNPKPNSFIYANWEDDPLYVKDQKGDILKWDFYGGNLKGIIEKLDYLKDLGVSIIYLSPIFEAQSNHKYDTGDYLKVDPMFGDEKILKQLINKAKERDMSVILDGVFSHTGDDSVYFNKYKNYDSIGAYQSKESPYYNWYNFKAYPDEYECWWGIKALPNVNELEPSYMEHIITGKNSVIKKWMKLGIKGWRLDVADELPEEFLESLSAEEKTLDPDSILIGEVWEDATNKISYGKRRQYLLGNQLDGVMGYPFRDTLITFLKGEISSKESYRRLMTIRENYPIESFMANLNLLGTHDVPRILTELDSKDLTKLAVLFQMTYAGVPYIYYGDEAGLTGFKDPDNRKTYPWGREDEELLEFYKDAISLRTQYRVFREGDLYPLETQEGVIGFKRILKDSRHHVKSVAYIFINRTKEEKHLEIKDTTGLKYVDVMNKDIFSDNGVMKINVPSLGYQVVLGEK